MFCQTNRITALYSDHTRAPCAPSRSLLLQPALIYLLAPLAVAPLLFPVDFERDFAESEGKVGAREGSWNEQAADGSERGR